MRIGEKLLECEIIKPEYEERVNRSECNCLFITNSMKHTVDMEPT